MIQIQYASLLDIPRVDDLSIIDAMSRCGRGQGEIDQSPDLADQHGGGVIFPHGKPLRAPTMGYYLSTAPIRTIAHWQGFGLGCGA